jgi:biopolymer transport protein TolQ
MKNSILYFLVSKTSIIEMMLSASLVVKVILLILFSASFISWIIIVAKYLYLKRAETQSMDFLEIFWSSKTLEDVEEKAKSLSYSPPARAFLSGYKEVKRLKKHFSQKNPEDAHFVRGIDNVKRAMEKEISRQKLILEGYLTFLATVGNTAPFIGLLGTVLGIINSFREIGMMGNPSLSVVAPGISEALVTTAIGLFTAIPAVAGYNYLLEKVKAILNEMDYFMNDFLNIVERHLL